MLVETAITIWLLIVLLILFVLDCKFGIFRYQLCKMPTNL